MKAACGHWIVAVLLGLLGVAGVAGSAQAQVPEKINYQGMLTTPAGTPVTASLAMVFKLYDVASGGVALYTETQTVTVTNGVFNVAIGLMPPFPPTLAFDVPYYLGVTVGLDPEMTPRQAVLASPYALQAAAAEDAQKLGGQTLAGLDGRYILVGGTITGAQITGAITSATLPAGNLTGTIGTTHIANNAVTQAKLSPTSGAAAGKVLGTDGSNLQWQTIAGGVSAVTASAPLASSGGSTPNVSLSGSVPVASGGTGQTTLATNAILYGQGTAGVGTAVGADGQVLAGVTSGPPAWTGSPSLSGSLVLANSSSASTGNIIKNGNSFIHNFGTHNTFIGERAGNFTMTGSGNTASGAYASSKNSTGGDNTATGMNALFNNMTGGYNTASGYAALYFNQTGWYNTANGRYALLNNTTGANNIAVGYRAGHNLTTGDHNIMIGNEGVADEGATIRVGTAGAHARTFVAGIRGVTPGVAGALPVVIDSNGQLGTTGGPAGTVTSVGTGIGLTGGPITSAGTVALAAGYQLPQSCLSGQVPKSNGAGGWTCADSNSGTVTSVGTGSGLTGGPITGSGTIAIANSGVTAAMLASNGCASGQIMKWSGSAWMCTADDDAAAGGVAGQVLTGTGSAPAWSGSPSLSGNLTLASPSTASAGNIMKGADRFIHNFGDDNTFIGWNAGNFSLLGFANTGSGAYTLRDITTGSHNTASGAAALANNTTGMENTASGRGALYSNTTGHWNTADGMFALFNNATGERNTASGTRALYLNASGSDNTANGYRALYRSGLSVGAGALAVGVSYTINYVGTTDFTLLGAASNTVGTVFTATGTGSGTGTASSNTSYNTATGAQALFYNATGERNTASGSSALRSNSSGNDNVANGASALYSNLSGNYNTASGVNALKNNTEGINNTASGAESLRANQTGSWNTADGIQALYKATGDWNVAIGANAGYNLIGGSYNIMIGSNGAAADSNTIRIGDANRTRAFISGIRGVTTGYADAVPVLIDHDGQLGTASSSRRFKDDIADMDEASAALMRLRPVTFHYRTDRSSAGRTLQYGLIAEEVAEVYPGLVARSSDGRIETVMYQFLPPMLLNEYQKQQRTIEMQSAQLARQATRIAELEKQTAEIAMLKKDRQAQVARIEALEAQALEIAALKRQMAKMAQLEQQAARVVQVAARLGTQQ